MITKWCVLKATYAQQAQLYQLNILVLQAQSMELQLNTQKHTAEHARSINSVLKAQVLHMTVRQGILVLQVQQSLTELHAAVARTRLATVLVAASLAQ